MFIDTGHSLYHSADGVYETTPVRCGGFLVLARRSMKDLETLSSLNKKKILISQDGWQAMVPLENLLEIICDVASITHLA